MLRLMICALLAVGFVAATSAGSADDKATKQEKQPKQKNQMVKGTVKSIDVKTGVLVVAQQLKGEKVDRQLDIKATTEFDLTIDGKKVEVSGKEGLEYLKEG